MGSAMKRFDTLGMTTTEVQKLLKEFKDEHPDKKILLGRGWLFNALVERPHRSILDSVEPDLPVFIDSADLHACWLNSAALKALGLDDSSPDPAGGSYERDANGKLTGLIFETAVHEVAWPWLANQSTLEDRLDQLRLALDNYLATGVTGVVEMALTPEDLEALEEYHKRYTLPIPVHAHWLLASTGTPEEHEKTVRTAAAHRERLRHLAPHLQVVGVKIISDGVVDSCTAYLKEPYYNGSRAEPIWPKEQMIRTITLADSLDLQVAVHAIGDAASEAALDAIEEAVKANGNRPLRQHRIEHLEVVTRESVHRIAKLGIVASLQPVHADPFYTPNWRLMLGNDERCDRAFPWTEYVESHAKVSFGSDCPTAPHHTCPNLFTATTRRSALDPKMPEPTDPRILLLDRFKLKLATAMRFYTLGSAQSIRLASSKGSLEAGKDADFAIMTIDPFADGLETLKEAQECVVETWIGGKKAWSRV